MKFGFYLPTRGENASRKALRQIVSTAEAAGFHSVMIADHIAFPVEIESKYPYTVDGGFPGHGDALEQLSLMSFIAGSTEKLRLVTSVMILPHRNPVFTAKALATIDVLSEGRVTVGVGVGWLREEFEALAAPEFDRRGAVSNEYIEIFRKLWTESPAEHSGEFYRFKALRCEPHPIQKPHPPIWIGGHSRPALRRTAKYGDGWHPVGATAAAPLGPDEFRGLLNQLKRLTEAEGRNYEDITISFKAPIYDPGVAVAGAERRPFTGAPDQILSDIRQYEELGVSELIFDFRRPDLTESLEQMERFSKEILREAA